MKTFPPTLYLWECECKEQKQCSATTLTFHEDILENDRNSQGVLSVLVFAINTHTHARVCLLFRSPQARLRVKQRSVCSVSLMLLRGQYLHTIATPASATGGSVESRWIAAGGKSQRKMKFSRCASAAPDAAPCYCWEGSRVSRWVSKSRVWKREEKTQGKLTFIFILFATKSRKQEMGTCMSITINRCCFIELEYYGKKTVGKI